MNASTDWTSAVAILAAGLILGGIVFFFFRSRKASQKIGGEADLVRKDLEAKRDALIQQLRDPDLTADERTRLELETAAALRALDSYKATHVPTAATTSNNTMDPTIKGFLWGAGSVAMLAALAFFVWHSASPREEGGTLTGSTPMQGQPQAQQARPNDPMVAQFEAAVQQDPNNLELRNNLAQAYLERDNMMGVFEQTKFVLERKPDDSRALTFQGLVRMTMGELPAAMSMIQRATKSDPKNMDAWVALAWLYVQQDREKEGEAMIAEAVKQSPSDKARLDEVWTAMKKAAADAKTRPQQASAMPGEPLPEGHPPIEGTSPAPTAAPSQNASNERSVRVTVDLDPSARGKRGVLFVMARNPLGGPPAAVKRMMVTQFPVTFDLGTADSMMGQPLPDKFRLEARLDSDGDAMTKVATDPAAAQEGVTPGAKVRLELK